MKDIRDDIKGARLSHLSSPVGNDTEFHLRDSETGAKPKVDNNYFVVFPVKCTSASNPGEEGTSEDAQMSRFVQMGNPIVIEGSNDLESKTDKLRSIAKKLFKAK